MHYPTSGKFAIQTGNHYPCGGISIFALGYAAWSVMAPRCWRARSQPRWTLLPCHHAMPHTASFAYRRLSRHGILISGSSVVTVGVDWGGDSVILKFISIREATSAPCAQTPFQGVGIFARAWLTLLFFLWWRSTPSTPRRCRSNERATAGCLRDGCKPVARKSVRATAGI